MAQVSTTTSNDVPGDDAHRFLAALHPAPAGNKILIWTVAADGRMLSHFCDSAEQAAYVALRHRDGHNVYVGVGLSPSDFGKHRRCCQDKIAGTPGVWLDADVKGPTHGDGAADSVEIALAAAAHFPLKPTLIINSGTGIHLYWLFKEPWLFGDVAERQRAKTLLTRFGRTMESHANGLGFSVKGTFNLDRVMRVPGTLNLCKGKGEPRPTSIIEANTEQRYGPDDIEQYLLPGDSGDLTGDHADVGVSKLDAAPVVGVPARAAARPANAAARCLRAMMNMSIVDHNDGSKRMFAAACRTVEHDLNEAEALATIRSYMRDRPFPRAWGDDEILVRVRDAGQHCRRGDAFEARDQEHNLVPLGERDPATGRLVLSPKRTLPTTLAYLQDLHQHNDGRTFHSYAGLLLEWRGNRYVEVEQGAMRQRLLPWLDDALRYAYNHRDKRFELRNFESNPKTVSDALDSISATAHLAADTTPTAWIRPDRNLPDPRELLPCRSATLHVPTGRLLAPTPNLLNTNALDFDYDPKAEPCERWTAFLEQLWGDDLEAVQLLQEFCGYSLVGDTSLQKMLLMVGPRRSGKGTIGRVLRSLVGACNVVGPTTSSLAGTFGLQPLIGKSLAIVSDARFSGDKMPIVVERLLCISGEDMLTIDRKFLTAVTMRLPTRSVFLSNELPRLNDASSALAGRFVILRMHRSFYGQEDTTLESKLMAELPGILLWAIEGLRRLRKRGYFVQPKSVEDAVREMEDLASSVGAFVRECCEVGPGRRVMLDALYQRWQDWCAKDGRTSCSTKQTFGRDLLAAVAGIVCRRNHSDGRFYEGIGLKAPEWL